tara:strand:+ start:117 stop:383 length:267 start_codon:yes stop_codon:yes gene_type:complete
VRLAGSDEVFDQLSASAQNSDVQHVENVIEQIEILRARGMGDQAAIQHGLNIWAGNEEAVSANPRFAAIYGDVPVSPPGNNSPGDTSD